jgi:hypothetical protein
VVSGRPKYKHYIILAKMVIKEMPFFKIFLVINHVPFMTLDDKRVWFKMFDLGQAMAMSISDDG